MRSASSVVALTLSLGAAPLMAQHLPPERQIAEAVTPLPQAMHAGATVLGYLAADSLVVLRRGANDMICLADDPRDDRWHVACYHRELEPFMARGRQLRAQGITSLAEINDRRRAEIEAGTLPMPAQPRALYQLGGPQDSFDPATGDTGTARALDVVYLPYATEASTGLSTAPSRERPWLMFPGEPWAHLMIPR